MCSTAINLANSCYLDNWTKILGVVVMALAVAIVFGFIFQFICLSSQD